MGIEKRIVKHDDDSYAEIYHKKGDEDFWHREDGPARIQYNKYGLIEYESYWVNNKPHREDGPARIEYNTKQNREDRKIKNYFKKVCDSQNDIACEIIIELGDMDFWNDKSNEYRLKMIDVYKEQVKDLVKIVPTFKVVNATIHFDETSPHMHIVGVPIMENCTRGMKNLKMKYQLKIES